MPLPEFPAAIIPAGAVARVLPLDRWRWDDAGLEQWTRELFPRALDRRRIEFAAGRSCAARAIEQLTGQPTPATTIGRDAGGGPAWPAGLIGSLAHCHHLAGAIVMRRGDSVEGGVGLDIEPIMAAARAAKLARKILTRDESAAMQATAALSDAEATSIAFSVKEALFKCLHPPTRRMFFLSDAAVGGVDLAGDTGTVDVRLTTRLSDAFADGRCFRASVAIREGVVFAVVAI